MNRRLLALGIITLGYLALVVGMIGAWIIPTLSYDPCVDAVLSQLHREDLRAVIQQRYFSTNKFYLVQKLSMVVGVLASLLLLGLHVRRKVILLFLQHVIDRFIASMHSFYQELKRLSPRAKMALSSILLLIFTRSIWLSYTFDIQYDEAWNDNYFLHQPLYNSVFAYNNYPLHNVLTRILLFILPHNTFTIRLSVIVFGCLSSLSFFFIIKRISKETWLAILALALFASLPVSMYYMLYARGVMVNIFFLSWSFYFLYLSSQRNLSRFEYGTWACIQALAMYAMFSHAYFLVLSTLIVLANLILQKKYVAIGKFLLVQIVSLLLIGVLLLPMVLGTGIQSGIQAGLHSGSWLSLHHLPYHCYAEFYTGFWFGFYPLLLLNIVFLGVPKLRSYRFLMITNFVLLASIPLIHWFSSVYPPERSLTYLIIPVLITLLLGFILLGKKMGIGLGILLCLILNYTAYHSLYLNWSKTLDAEVKALAYKLMDKQVKVLYNTQDEFNYFVPGLTYYFQCEGRPFVYYTNQPASTRFRAIESLNTIDAVVERAHAYSQDSCIYLHEYLGVYLKR